MPYRSSPFGTAPAASAHGTLTLHLTLHGARTLDGRTAMIGCGVPREKQHTEKMVVMSNTQWLGVGIYSYFTRLDMHPCCNFTVKSLKFWVKTFISHVVEINVWCEGRSPGIRFEAGFVRLHFAQHIFGLCMYAAQFGTAGQLMPGQLSRRARHGLQHCPGSGAAYLIQSNTAGHSMPLHR